jgi:hypothetical protein
MVQRDTRPQTQTRKGFHDASARETYAARFRPIGIQAVAAGTRQLSGTLSRHGKAPGPELPGVLRHGFSD